MNGILILHGDVKKGLWRAFLISFADAMKALKVQEETLTPETKTVLRLYKSNSNSNYYKPKWHRGQCLGQKLTRVRCARVKK
jgi:hypothetical protein